MSAEERDQMVAIKAVDAGQITQRQAARQLGRTERQVRRILQRYRAEVDAGLIHRSRGLPSNRRIDPEVKERSMEVAAPSPLNPPLPSEPTEAVSDVQIERYTTEMADDVASLIEDSFAEHRDARPLTFLSLTAPWTPRAELLATLRSERLCSRSSHVALHDGRPVSAALAVGDDTPGWWRIATAAPLRRRGLASACIKAGQKELARAGHSCVHTEAVVDSRWAAAALLGSHGYELDDPDQRNITMIADDWTPRPVHLPEGFSLETLREEHLDEWMAVRNAVFGGDHGAEWFRERFMSRPDYHAADWKIARHEGRIAGIAGAICVEDERDPDRIRGAQIEWVGVLKQHRGLHLGQELVVACMNHAAQRGFLPVLLLTQPFRVPAVNLYEKLGFVTTAAWQRWTRQLR